MKNSELPTGWVIKRLSEVAEVKLGRQRSPKNHSGPFMHPYLRAANVTWAGLSLHDVKEMNFAPSELETFHLKPGDVLVAEASGSRSEVGKAAIWRGEIQDCCFQNTLLRVRSRGPLSEFLLLVLRHAATTGQFGNAARGVGIHHLGAKALSEWPIVLPPEEEQREIVAEIDKHMPRLAAAGAALQGVGRNLKRYRASVLHLASSGRLLPLSMTGSVGGLGTLLDRPVAPTDEVGLPTLPDGWIWTRLESLLDSLRNGIFVSRPDMDPEGLPIFRISAVRPMRLNADDVRYAHDVEESKANQYFVEEDDLLLTRYSGNPDYVGACARVKSLDRLTLHPDKLIRAKVRREVVLPAFLEIALSAGPSRNAIRTRVKTTAGQTGISGSDLKSVPVPLPPLEHQEAIVEETERHLSLIEKLEVSVEANIRRGDALRQAILSGVFLGKLTPQGYVDGSATDERAAAL